VDAPAALDLAGGADDRAGEADIALDDCGDLVRRGASVHLLEGLLAAFLQARLTLGLIECGGKNAPTAVAPGAPLCAARCSGCCRHGYVIGTV
jgi:hypothetical protein